jgi:diguanylate cyclase
VPAKRRLLTFSGLPRWARRLVKYARILTARRSSDDITGWRPRLFCSVFLIIVIAIMTAAGTLLRESRAGALNDAADRMSGALSIPASSINRSLQDLDDSLSDDAQRLAVIDAQHRSIHDPIIISEFRNTLIQQMAKSPSVVSMSISDADGQWAVSSQFAQIPGPSPSNPRSQATRQEALNTVSGHTFVYAPEYDSPFHVHALIVGRPARTADGRFLGTVMASLATDILRQPFDVMAKEAGRHIVISNPDGACILDLQSRCNPMPEWMQDQWHAAIGHGGGSFRAVDQGRVMWLVAVSGSAKSSMVFTAIEKEGNALRDWQGYYISIIIIVAVALIGLTSVFVLWLRQRWQTARRAIAARDVQQQLLHTLSHDPISKLYNRLGIRAEVDKRGATLHPQALHLIGIDRFQTLLDVWDNDTADFLIVQLGERLRSVLGPRDLAARLGNGDLCIVQYDGDPDDLSARTFASLAAPYRFGERDMRLGISIGIVPVGKQADWLQLRRDGTAAMRRARDQNSSKISWFEAARDRPSQERSLIEQELRSAIGTDQLYMVYQPIYNIAEDRISGFESLMRWKHPVRGEIPTTTFIPIAESSGLLLPIEHMVKRSPLMAATAWPENVSVSVNFGALEFRDPGLPERVRQRLDMTGINPQRYVIEVTESSFLADDDVTIGVMRAVKDLGVKLALDDFGTGHASMSYLHKFPFDRIKIDKSFVTDMDSSTGAAAIIEATMALSRRLKLLVVAEGVTTLKQLDRLRDMGCTHVQGYLISRPMIESEVLPFFAKFSLHALEPHAMQV